MNTVLVATERDLEHNVLTQALDGRGYQIVRSRDGLDALEVARSNAPQVLLVNVSLPKLDGFALFRRFQQDEQLRQIPIVLFSTRSNDQKSERFAQELGAPRFVGNALKPGALDGVLESAMAAQTPPLPTVPTAPSAQPAPPAIDATLKLPALSDSSEDMQQAQLLQALQTAQQQLDGAHTWQSVFNLSPVAMWVVGKNSQKMLAVNEAALRLFAYSHGEFMQLDSPAALRDPGQASTTNVFAFHTKDGRALSLLVNTRELNFRTQAAELWVAHDVSYRVRGERAMADEVQRVRAILANLPVAYWVINADAQLSDANAAGCRLLGYSREQLLEYGLARLLGDARLIAELQALPAGQQLSLAVSQGDGTRRKMEFTAGQGEFAGGLRLLLLRAEPEPSTVSIAPPVAPPKLPAVLEMLRYAEDADETTLLQYAMAQLASAFDSPLALFASLERVTQTLDVCATSEALTRRRSIGGNNIAIPAVWHDLLMPRSNCVSQGPDAALLVDGLPEMSSYVACSSGHGPELWLLVIANREAAYSPVEQREVQECTDILVALLARMKQQARLQTQASRSAAAADSMVGLLETLLDHHDAYAAASGARMAGLAVHIARQLNLAPERQKALALAARLHDIGCLLLPQSLLLSPAVWSDGERTLMQTHVERGVRLLNGVDVGADVAAIVAQHHERLDGSGYPAALRDAQITLEARILGVVDVMEAMCSPRSYRPACGRQEALAELRAGAGLRYDTDVVAACERVFAGAGEHWPL